ncbi:MAG: 16S rRNA (uracil(1498)-N(3))-methyltransferase [Rhodobacteraceae bacterium]|nr:16S rRNA (uracil(1498)-N(3))-methyltransferase [Paracoccaceae bacterium]MCY4250242.1 16S rRNA (uracil(1498)-N(3))-methyltransferase [Paracoccaceae bacterium]
MSFRKNRARLFVESPLGHGIGVKITGQQFHYLKNVLRIRSNQSVSLFNGCEGEWKAKVKEIATKKIVLFCEAKTRKQLSPPDFWYLFAPLKKARLDFAIEKVTEIGVSKIIPVITEFTQSTRISTKRLQAIAMEATEQCGGLKVPEVMPPESLSEIIGGWPPDRDLIYCDELAECTGEIPSVVSRRGKLAILIGPEGGFSQKDRELIDTLDESCRFSLGKRILRAETAAVSAFSLIRWHYGNGFLE